MVLCALALSACKKQSFDDAVLAEVEQFNTKEAPKRIDPFTTFDSMRYDRNSLRITYFYSVETDMDINQFPTEEMKAELLKNLHTSIQLKAHKERGLLFHYLYLRKGNNEKILDCTFSPEDYR